MKLTPINAPPLDEPLKPVIHLEARPDTDLWLKPPAAKAQNMSCHVAHLPVSEFHFARVTVKANWVRQYDQGGLILFLPAWLSHSVWVKTGIEFVDGRVNVSTVGARHAADWSLIPMPEGKTSVTIEFAREEVNDDNGTGASLWVYLIEDGERKAIREMSWVFKEEADMGGDISVGIYAARPTKYGLSDEETLDVAFNDLIMG